MATGTRAQVSVKPETLSVIQNRSSFCDICKKILESMGEGNTLTEGAGIAIDAQKRHIKAELAKSIAQQAIAPAPEPPKEEPKAGEKNGWSDHLSEVMVQRLNARIPKDEDSPGCQLCKYIVISLGPGNKLQDYPRGEDIKQMPVKSQKAHLALEFGETEA